MQANINFLFTTYYSKCYILYNNRQELLQIENVLSTKFCFLVTLSYFYMT